jgi:hypothetical protein
MQQLPNNLELSLSRTYQLQELRVPEEKWLPCQREIFAASHIAAVLDFHYVPGDWTDKQPSNLSEGANLGHKLIEAARGMKMRPVATYLITNYDNTAYYHMGSLGSDRNGGIQWTREVSSADTLLVRVSAESVARGKTQELTLSRRGVKSFHVLESR